MSRSTSFPRHVLGGGASSPAARVLALLSLASLALNAACAAAQDKAKDEKATATVSVTDPDLAYLKGLPKSPAALPADLAEDAAQRVEDMILDTTYPDGLEETRGFLKDPRLPLAPARRDTLDKVADIRLKVAQIRKAREEAKAKPKGEGEKPDPDQADTQKLESDLFDRVFEVFFDVNLNFQAVLRDYLKFQSFLRQDVVASIKDSTLKRTFGSSLSLLNQQVESARRKAQDNSTPLPGDKPIPITVKNVSTVPTAILTILVFDKQYKIDPGKERAFRFVDRLKVYTDFDYSGGSEQVSPRDYPVTQSGTRTFSLSYSQQQWSCTTDFQPAKGVVIVDTKEAKPGGVKEGKPGEVKPGEVKEAKPGEGKEGKPGEVKEAKPGEVKTGEVKEVKPGEVKEGKTQGGQPSGTGPGGMGWHTILAPAAIGLMAPASTTLDEPSPEVIERIGVDGKAPPKGLKDEPLTSWSLIISKGTSFYNNPSFAKIYDDYKNKGTKGSLDPNRYPKPDEVANLLDACDEIAQLCVEAVEGSKGKDRSDGYDRFQKIAPFWQCAYDLVDELLLNATFDPDKLKDERRKLTQRKASDRHRIAMRNRRNSMQKVPSLISGDESSEGPKPGPIASPTPTPAPNLAMEKRMDRLSSDLVATRISLSRRVEEVNRARTQSYSAWRPDATGRVYTCSFRYRPDGTDTEGASTCFYFEADPSYVYYFGDVRSYRACVNGGWRDYSAGVCWGRYNVKTGPFTTVSWEAVPEDRRQLIPFGTMPSPEVFAAASRLPSVPSSLGSSQFLLWPALVGLPTRPAGSPTPAPVAPTGLAAAAPPAPMAPPIPDPPAPSVD